MATRAKKDDPKLWERVKQEVTAHDKGGRPGQWSARKAQLASHEYQKRGGGYIGAKTADNHLQQWTQQAWGTESGKPSAQTGERYLPEQARHALTEKEYRRSSAKKRADTRQGKQYSAQPAAIAAKAAKARHTGLEGQTKPALLALARQLGIKGRSRMRKQQLLSALQDQGMR
ncbi:Rho termination factor N-terminal domain-containing protein [Pseudomonas sp. RIT-PI-S]|uniref:Rho termination factor N-terminal domain-containing protein n=1 Tax=Pseudomonas sp. RIT-PI-S TaxID=3035295 RepID=UPI0021D97BA5|nr:Rho termination factor N-terminal domain-containing protein [Pseudomonas sp. RIT-PI-S]